MCCSTETQDDSDGSLEGAGFLCKTRMWGCWEERTEMSVSDPKKERMGLSQRKAPLGEQRRAGRSKFPEHNSYCQVGKDKGGGFSQGD